MNSCEWCAAQCCLYPMISWPNSGQDQLIDWIYSWDGEFFLWWDVKRFLEIFQQRLLDNIHPPLFFSSTQKSERQLQVYGIELDTDKRKDSILFFFRVLFLCPEFNEDTKKCSDYDDRPNACKNFLCADRWWWWASRVRIEEVKKIDWENLFRTYEEVIWQVEKIIQAEK